MWPFRLILFLRFSWKFVLWFSFFHPGPRSWLTILTPIDVFASLLKLFRTYPQFSSFFSFHPSRVPVREVRKKYRFCIFSNFSLFVLFMTGILWNDSHKNPWGYFHFKNGKKYLSKSAPTHKAQKSCVLKIWTNHNLKKNSFQFTGFRPATYFK